MEPASRSAVERNRLAARRVEQFATVVFALAMALPVILLIDDARAAIAPGRTLTDTAVALLPAFGASAVAMLILLSSWFIHHLEFHYLTRSSGPLLLLHAALLPALLTVPFSAMLLNSLSLTLQSLLLLAGNALLIQLLLMLLWRHAVKGGLLFGGDVPRRVVVRFRLLLDVSVAAIVAVCIAALLNPLVSFGGLVAICLAQIALIARGGYTLDVGSSAARASGPH
ncbi:MAG: DUF1211 domain-containing protein [Dehalococcoidia bacterium]|nr:DUF1211 domain-containing protein [Dehalococcoidia bacterium]